MRIFLIAALVLAVFALIVALGNAFVTTWAVWLAAAFVAYFLDCLVGDRIFH